ncbi:MAG: beta-galactosidase trimerization domain-containing protein [Lentisphaeria bacterium]|nr:beta-galactosidase trimerization domain-containing protein [Lentisphaeria bacterium]
MKKSLLILLILFGVCVLCGAESKFNYLKVPFRGYPKDPAVTVQSKRNGSNRVLIFNVTAPKAMSSIYTYSPVEPGKKYMVSYLYKLSGLQMAEGKRTAARIQINFQNEKGLGIKGLPPYKFDLELKNTAGSYVKASTVFTVPANASRIQAVLLNLNNIAGKFEITNVNITPVSDHLPAELKSAYKTAAYWSNWPRNNAITLERSADRRGAIFTAAQPGDNAACYTYLSLQKRVTYSIRFKLSCENIIRTPGGSAMLTLDFHTKAGKASGDAPVQWKLDLPAQGQTREYNFEFTAPGNSESARMHILRLKGMGGKFIIKDLYVEPIADSVVVARTSDPIVPDGKLTEPVWSESGKITRFYRFGTGQVQEVESEMYIAYDDKNLYLGVCCFEPEAGKIVARETKHDSPVWHDDSVELFVASPNNRAMQLVFNTIGGHYDCELYQRVPGDPWRGMGERNYSWQTGAAVEKDRWTAELVLPFKEFGLTPKPGQKWRINIVRNRRVPGAARGSTQWNMQSGSLKNVDKFGTLEFNDEFGVLNRYREEMLTDPLKVERKEKLFAQLPRKAEGGYKVYSLGAFLINSYSPKFKKENASTWHLRQKQMLEEMKDATDATPIGYPWLSCFGTREELLELLQKNNWKFTCNLHNSSQDRQAIREGAVLKVRANLVNAADPLLHKITMAWGHDRFKKDAWIIPHLAWVVSTDEPTNTIYESHSVTKNVDKTAELNQISEEIKKEHGFGKYGLFDNFAPNDDADAPFRRIAFLKYWNEKVIAFKRNERDLVKHYAPEVPFMAVNAFNTVSTFRGIEVFPDFAGVSDIGCVDPYPTSTLAQCGRERALYHTGFSAKTLHDMNRGKLTAVYIQAFNYCGRAPVAENLREWASQALKNGADILRWYTDANLETAPGCYEEMIRISRIVRKMKPLALPEKSPVGILYSYVAHWGKFDIEQNAEYALYAIMGEKLKGNFKFISDYEVADGRTATADYKLIIAPNLKYLTRTVADKLVEYVENGGRLIIMDAEAFAFANDGNPLAAQRQKLIGAEIGRRRSDKSVIFNGKESVVEAAYSVKAPADAKIIAVYADNTPAAFERNVGKGSVVYFAAEPFRSARQINAPGEWGKFLAGEMRAAGETLDHKFWDFMIPEN